MPRLRANQSVASPSTVSKKRAAPETVSTPLRQSKRARNSSNPSGTPLATPKKSEYFEPSETEAESEIENEKSGYEDEDQSASVLSSLADTDAEEDASEDDRPRKRNVDKKMTSNKAKKATNGNTVQGQELWRPGVKADVEPGVQVFIKLPKARQPGKNPYKDGTIHPNTMLFLGDLKANNDREWLKVHDADYRQAKKDFESFVECLTEKVIEKDETIPELPPKDLVFRIYRDVRFSSDPTPYKTHFSAAWSRTGRKGPYAHYYMQIAPDDTFIGGGIWMPEAQPLALLRNDVDHRSRKIKKVLMDAGIRKEFLDGARGNEQECITAFIGRNKENMLKTKPKGYTADNPNIELLRLRNYTIGKKLKDDEVVGPNGLKRIGELFGTMAPWITYLNSVVMPDVAEDEEGDDEPGSADDVEDEGAENEDDEEEDEDEDEGED